MSYLRAITQAQAYSRHVAEHLMEIYSNNARHIEDLQRTAERLRQQNHQIACCVIDLYAHQHRSFPSMEEDDSSRQPQSQQQPHTSTFQLPGMQHNTPSHHPHPSSSFPPTTTAAQPPASGPQEQPFVQPPDTNFNTFSAEAISAIMSSTAAAAAAATLAEYPTLTTEDIAGMMSDTAAGAAAAMLAGQPTWSQSAPSHPSFSPLQPPPLRRQNNNAHEIVTVEEFVFPLHDLQMLQTLLGLGVGNQSSANNLDTAALAAAAVATFGRSNNNNNNNNDGTRVPSRMTPASIDESIQNISYGELRMARNGGNNNELTMPLPQTCPISMEGFQDDQIVSVIRNCNHVFHRTPLLRWLQQSTSCPLCRRDVRISPPPQFHRDTHHNRTPMLRQQTPSASSSLSNHTSMFSALFNNRRENNNVANEAEETDDDVNMTMDDDDDDDDEDEDDDDDDDLDDNSDYGDEDSDEDM